MSTQLLFWGGLLAWVPAFVIALSFGAQSASKVLGWLPVALVAFGFPFFDQGFFWRDWNSPDATPGQGLTTAVFVILGGLAILALTPALTERSRPAVPQEPSLVG